MIVLNCDNVSFSIGVKDILKDVSFTAQNDDKIGIIGVNGAGKTTLFRIITGEINPGIGKFDSRLKTDLGRMMLAVFIVLTPGTCVVDVDDDGVFYVHSIYLPSATPTEADLCRNFAIWVRRIAE